MLSYAILSPLSRVEGSGVDGILKDLETSGLVSSNEARLGSTKLFLKASVIGRLEEARDAHLAKVTFCIS